SRDVHDRLGRRCSLSESPPSLNSKDSRRKHHKRVSSSSSDSSDNEDEETGHWKSRNEYRNQEDEDMSRPWRRQKVDAFTRRISDFSEDKRRRMPANVKTYDGTGDPDDDLEIFESAATIENWPQPMWSIDGFEELQRAFRLNFTQRKKCAKNRVELARVKQRQGQSTSAYVEHYKDECIHVKACPEILKISGFMNGINNPELEKPPLRTAKKSYSNYKSQQQPRRQSNDHSSNHNNSYRNQRGDRGNDKYTPLTKTPKEILATEGANFPKPPPMRTPEERHVGNRYCEYHGQKGHTTNEYVQLRQLIDKLVKECRLDHLVKNIKEGKDKQKSGGGHDIHRMYIDGGASANILYEHCFQRLRPEVKSHLLPYNDIIRRPGISAIRAVPSTAYGMLKFHVDGGIVTIYNTIVPARECNTVACDATQTQTHHAAKVINLKVAIHPDYPEQEVNVTTNDDERRIDLDLLEERRERAAICEAKAKSKMKGYYDAKVRGVSFRPGDFVYRANGTSHAEDVGKLGPKWEGPYEESLEDELILLRRLCRLSSESELEGLSLRERLQSGFMGPTATLGQATILPHAFTSSTLQDPVSDAWNMDTCASSYLNDFVTSVSDVFNT
nr:reverse transcriptase domain-containing protein [Tanacetum cinerariifolium]